MFAGACGGASGDVAPTSETGSTGADDDVMTTLPITVTFGDTSGDSSGAMDGTTAIDPDTGASTSTGGDDTTGASGTGGTTEDSTDATGSTAWDVEWCRLQAPASVRVAAGTPFTVYGRLYAAGLTDQTTLTDADPQLAAEVGWGVDGSDPAAGAWTWTVASPNGGFDGNDWGEPNNDEYMADLSIPGAGVFDYAFRVSGDGGVQWVYCDLDDLLTGGYTPDQAGDAQISPA
jgi:hypothetical protein